MENKVALIIATVALGLGVDKTNIRYVLHFSMPYSIETYA
jgi:ATP-dependent DNA helicase RecQ